MSYLFGNHIVSFLMMRLKYCFYSQTSHPKATKRSTPDRKRCDTKKGKTDIFGKMLCQVKIIDIHGQPKGEKNKYIQSDLPPGMFLHFYFPENEIPRLIRVTVPHMGGKGQFCQTVAVS